MAVRKTEKQIPQIPGFTIDDLGQHAASSTNAQLRIVSYLSSPLSVNMRQDYVVFVEDTAVQPNVASYEWIFNNNGTSTPLTTPNGVATFTPTQTGPLNVTVHLKNSANVTLHSVVLQQQVAVRNLELEQLINQEGTPSAGSPYVNYRSPSAGNPDISREVINGLRVYADAVASPVTDNALNRLILSIIYSTISVSNATARNTLLENCAGVLDSNVNNFFSTAQSGIGITTLRPHVAAMFILAGASSLIPVTEIPAGATTTQRNATSATIETAFNSLSEERRIAIFNLLRFPKSHIRVCKMVLDGLKSRYFPTETYAIILGNRTKGRRLITEYNSGPYAPPTNNSDLSRASDSVFNLMLIPVWRISVSAITNGAGTIDPQTRLFGIPEPIPEKTYIANTGIFSGDAAFINSGRAYHANFNISYTTIESFEEIIDDLQANSTIFNHMRIFAHANQDLLALSLFRGGPGYLKSYHLDGFNVSELEGVMGIFTRYFSSPGMHIDINDRADEFLDHLRSISSPSLVPFGLQTPPTPPPTLSPELRALFRRYIDIWLVNIPGTIKVGPAGSAVNINSTQRSVIISLIDVIIRLIKPSVTASIAGLNDTHFDDLRAAILAVTRVNLGWGPTDVPFTYRFDNPLFTDLRLNFTSTARALAAGNTFMAKLAHVKNNRFNATSFIDIRGCLAGQQPPGTPPPPRFLVSIQHFFGSTSALPTVTGPEWLQSFDVFYANYPLADNAAIDTVLSAGVTFTVGTPSRTINLTATQVSDSFDTWSRLSNLDDQFTFFTNLFSSTPNLIDFASLRWRTWRQTGSTTGIPPLHLYASRADDMVQLPLGELINRLRENFSASGTNLAAAVVTRLNTLQPKIEDFKLIQEQLASYSGSVFTTFYNNLSTLASQILAISGMPASSTPLVDAPMPTSLNVTHINGYITNIITYLTNYLTTDIGTIFSNIRTAIGAANAKAHYYFNIRLPMRTEITSNLPIREVQSVIFYIAGAVADAVKSYMKCQWTGTPSQIDDMHQFIDGRTITNGNSRGFMKTAILSDSSVTAPSPMVYAMAPLPAYNSHIKST